MKSFGYSYKSTSLIYSESSVYNFPKEFDYYGNNIVSGYVLGEAWGSGLGTLTLGYNPTIQKYWFTIPGEEDLLEDHEKNLNFKELLEELGLYPY